MTTVRGLSLATFWLLMQMTAAQSQAEPQAQAGREGVLIMAHGGREEWDAGVLESVAPLHDHYPLEVAFGMADATSLQAAVDRLESRGVDDIAVVRLFISGESWYDRTAQILGLQPGAPRRPPERHDTMEHGGGQSGHSMAFWRLDSDARFVMSEPGLADAEPMADVLLDRALALSETPSREDVLILAHGTGDDAENDRWLEKMDARAQRLRLEGGFHRVRVATLREDWPEKREPSAAAVRAFVEEASDDGRTALVIPYRVFGFGPYAETLEGLDYRADGRGLIPHPAVTRWIQGQITELFGESGAVGAR
ncbi:MAG: hypothetical protein ACQETO_13430 [Pseudomonadota bacterium]